MKARDEDVGKSGESLGDLIKEHETTDADLEAVWDQESSGMDSFHTDMVDLRFGLKECVTREEWAQLFSGQ